MSEMVERVARAMWEAREDIESDGGAPRLQFEIGDREIMVLARAAIAAMREPTEAMIDAGEHVAISVLAQTVNPEQIRSLVYTGIQEWRSMIDAALSEKKG